jgi:type 1 glutamine amidotransferase
MKIHRLVLVVTAALCVASSSWAADKLKVLIIEGQNNHKAWKNTTVVMKSILEECGRFTVDVSITPPSPAKGGKSAQNADQWKLWHPKFSSYDVVLSNYNGERWPANVDKEFVEYIRNGGGLVVIHAADNSFPDWPEYNEMIAVGGWGNRDEKSGPMIRWHDGKQVLDTMPGKAGAHGARSPFVVNFIVADHPITKGLTASWLHASDELYGRLRGPCKNVTVIANAMPAKGGELDPILMVIDYGKGRVFHDVLGHDVPAMVDIGFQVTLQRGTEWAATGKVTLPAPKPEDMATDKVIEHKLPVAPTK